MRRSSVRSRRKNYRIQEDIRKYCFKDEEILIMIKTKRSTKMRTVTGHLPDQTDKFKNREKKWKPIPSLGASLMCLIELLISNPLEEDNYFY